MEITPDGLRRRLIHLQPHLTRRHRVKKPPDCTTNQGAHGPGLCGRITATETGERR